MNTLYKCQRATRQPAVWWSQRLAATDSSTASKDDEPQPPTFLDDAAGEVQPPNPRMFNKSRLLPQHQNILHNKMPYGDSQSWIHQTEKYQRKIFGRYGAKSGIQPNVCFPTKEDVEAVAGYERVAFPHTLPEMMAKARQDAEQKRAALQQREDEIAKKMEKLEQWKADLNAKVAKREAETLAAKERKERLIEEVRRHFGFKVDPRDDRFKEMLEAKEREDKKKQREAKRKAKEDKMMAKLLEKTAAPGLAPPPTTAE